MARSSFVAAIALAVSPACSAGTEQSPAPVRHTTVAPAEPLQSAVLAGVAESEADLGIRRAFSLAIRQDPGLKDRQITFFVTNGDVSVTGVVRNEDERKRINDLAMNIIGVKSIANALRISEQE